VSSGDEHDGHPDVREAGLLFEGSRGWRSAIPTPPAIRREQPVLGTSAGRTCQRGAQGVAVRNTPALWHQPLDEPFLVGGPKRCTAGCPTTPSTSITSAREAQRCEMALVMSGEKTWVLHLPGWALDSLEFPVVRIGEISHFGAEVAFHGPLQPSVANIPHAVRTTIDQYQVVVRVEALHPKSVRMDLGIPVFIERARLPEMDRIKPGHMISSTASLHVYSTREDFLPGGPAEDLTLWRSWRVTGLFERAEGPSGKVEYSAVTRTASPEPSRYSPGYLVECELLPS
jgi:hypothetical protein